MKFCRIWIAIWIENRYSQFFRTFLRVKCALVSLEFWIRKLFNILAYSAICFWNNLAISLNFPTTNIIAEIPSTIWRVFYFYFCKIIKKFVKWQQLHIVFHYCLHTCILCCVFGTLWPFPWISQQRTLLSHDPAIK